METNSITQISSTSIYQLGRPSTAIAVKDMYIANDENSNLQWESINYKVPRQYHSAKSFKKNHTQKDAKRASYLDQVQLFGKKVPGVGHYNIDQKKRKSFSKWDGKCPKRRTLFVETYQNQKRCPTPGPASYFSKQNSSCEPKGTNLSRKKSVVKISYLDQVQYLGCTSPGIGQYNIFTNILKPSYRNNRVQRPVSSSSKPKHLKMSEINPIINGTFAQIQHVSKSKESGLKKSSFPRDKRFAENKQQSLIPAPNKYNHDKCVNSTLIKPQRIYY